MADRTPTENHRAAGTSYIDVVVIASSMGGVQVLRKILAELPANLPAPIVIIQHRTLHRPWHLDSVLSTGAALKVKYAEEGERLRPGTVYIGAHDKHLTIDDSHRMRYTNRRKIRHLRSSANPLFESAARVFRERTLAIVLTGGDSDATDGVQTVKQYRGVVVAQDRATSEVFSMPASAIATGCVDLVLPAGDVANAIVQIVTTGKYVRTS